jgi:hypothetical protein
VIAAIAERFVPIRVDTDRRPDVNARYNLGGWPTTAILTPRGEPLTGGTYIPPVQLRGLLGEVATAYREHKDEIASAIAERIERRRNAAPPEQAQLEPEIVETVFASIADRYDAEYGGFGSEPKFPMTDALEFLLLVYERDRDGRVGGMLSKTLLAMARGGMYDHIEGGFFRYSTTRDWTIPHFEKMAEDHAGLLRAYARASRLLQIAALRETLVSAVGYLRTVFRDPATGFFAGSQDADEVYYSLPLEERRKRQAPFVDHTVYAGWNAGLASGLLAAGQALEDDAIAADALQTLDALDGRMRDDDGLLFHYMPPGEGPHVHGLLTDQASYLRALVDAHAASSEPRFLERARTHARLILEKFGSGGGALLDAVPEEPLGRLDFPDRPLAENAIVADALLRLAKLSKDDQLAARGREILESFANSYRAAGLFAAPYAIAVARVLVAL